DRAAGRAGRRRRRAAALHARAPPRRRAAPRHAGGQRARVHAPRVPHRRGPGRAPAGTARCRLLRRLHDVVVAGRPDRGARLVGRGRLPRPHRGAVDGRLHPGIPRGEL
ncbi:MAG: Fluoride ion transporter CrcB, partial [uncultured Nocardioides sp.]